MSGNIAETLGNLVHQTAFFNLTWGNYLMIAVACVFLYLAIKKGYEPLLLVPIAFGMLLVNIYPDIMISPENASNGVGGLLHYFFKLDEWSILPSLIFLGVGALTDFRPLIANPISFLLGAAAQFGIFAAYLLAIVFGFSDAAAAAVSIIGGADGPTSIFLAGKLHQNDLMGPIAVAAYSYMSLVPIIQPPIMKLLTTKKERSIRMGQLREVSKLEAILFPIVVTIIVCLVLPTTAIEGDAEDVGEDLAPQGTFCAASADVRARDLDAKRFCNLKRVADGKRHSFEDSLHEIRPARVHRHAGERAAGVRVVDGAALAHEIGQEVHMIFTELFVGDIRLFARKIGRFQNFFAQPLVAARGREHAAHQVIAAVGVGKGVQRVVGVDAEFVRRNEDRAGRA